MRRLVGGDGLIQDGLDGGAAGETVPGGIDTVEEILGGGRATDDGHSGTAGAGAAHSAGALAVVHAAAEDGELFVGVAEDGIEGAGFDLGSGGGFKAIGL